MKTKVFTVVMLLSTLVFAWDKTQSQNQHQNQTVNSNNTQTNSHNNTATGGNSAASGGNASGQSVTENTNIPRMTPEAYAPAAIPTAPCRIGKSGGGSSPYFGIALGGSADDKECEKRVAAAAFADIGNPVAAARILCTLKAARAADLTLDDCLAFARPEPVPVPAPAPPEIIVPPPAVTINPVIEFPAPPVVQACPKPIHHKRPIVPCPTLEK